MSSNKRPADPSNSFSAGSSFAEAEEEKESKRQRSSTGLPSGAAAGGGNGGDEEPSMGNLSPLAGSGESSSSRAPPAMGLPSLLSAAAGPFASNANANLDLASLGMTQNPKNAGNWNPQQQQSLFNDPSAFMMGQAAAYGFSAVDNAAAAAPAQQLNLNMQNAAAAAAFAPLAGIPAEAQRQLILQQMLQFNNDAQQQTQQQRVQPGGGDSGEVGGASSDPASSNSGTSYNPQALLPNAGALAASISAFSNNTAPDPPGACNTSDPSGNHRVEQNFLQQLSMQQLMALTGNPQALQQANLSLGPSGASLGNALAVVERQQLAALHQLQGVASAQPSSSVRRGCISQDPEVIPHFNERDFMPLGLEEDQNFLTEFQCFIRSDFIEVFHASQQDVIVRSTSKSVQLGQIGIRCRYCAHLPPGSKASRSSAFPSNVRQLYQSFTMMLRDHFSSCHAPPDEQKARYNDLKKKNLQGACDSKQYWIYAAGKLGMTDSNGGGIQITTESQRLAKNKPPYGVSYDDPRSLPSAAPVVPVITPEDKDRATLYMYALMEHTQVVSLVTSECVGKRKSLDPGIKGIGCRFCCQANRLGFSRIFPLRRRALPEKLEDLFKHIQRCTLFPLDAKEEVVRLQKLDAAEKEENGGYNAATGRERLLLDKIWSDRLSRRGDLAS